MSEDIKVIYVSIDKIAPNPYQPRKNFDPASLDELADSIKEYGVLQPINVRQRSDGYFELIAGERRTKAAKLAGLDKIPAIISEVREEDSAVIAVIENIQRQDLNYMEEAESYLMLISEHGFTQEELARKIGKNQSTIANKMRLLKLPPVVRKLLIENKLTERHARALLKLPDEEIQLSVLEHIIKKELNVKASEEYIHRLLEKKKTNDRKSRIKGRINYNIYVNTIKNTYKQILNTGFQMGYTQEDKGEYIEIKLQIPKN